jgi:uncharacterized damage-inducible protein DinB
MAERENLAALLEEAYFGEPGRSGIAWHGESVNAIMKGIDAQLAARKLPGASHSIWEILVHIAQWDEICVRRLNGEVIDVTTGDPGDWPDLPRNLDTDNWGKALTRLKQAQQAMIDSARRTSDASLYKRVPGTNWSAYLMLHGTLHHDLHHAGQISVLKRLVLRGRRDALRASQSSHRNAK